jgi:hypothetical protein
MQRFAKLTLADVASDVEHRSTIHLGPIAPRGFGEEE